MDLPSKINFGSKYIKVCRCCLKADGISDIFSCFLESNDKETVGDMFNYTFNIQIAQLSNLKGLICQPCMDRLQDASAFKTMVLQSEDTLLQYLRSEEHPDADSLQEEEINLIKTEEGEEIFNTSQEFADDIPDDNETLANIKLNGPTEATGKRKKQKTELKSKSKRCKIKENDVEVGTSEKDWSKIAERRGSGPLLRENSLKLIQNSNLCVFQWNKSQYRCFCCNTPFTDINQLKQHTSTRHSLENIEKKIISQQNRLVKVEISNLECRLCREKLDSVSNLKQHLSRTHSMGIGEDLLVPFRVEKNLKCQICFDSFSVFRLLNIHINKHFQRQVCHICGAGFSNLVFLNLHKTRSHRPLRCKSCDVIFNSKSEKKHHDITVHGIKFEKKLRFPCPFCSERFYQENFKVRHLVDTHGMTEPVFRCEICSKSFITRSLCNNHVKNVHNKEKSHECDVCHHLFYTKSDVARHKVTHSGEKRFSCEVCTNPFATKDSLRRHMKRTHVGID